MAEIRASLDELRKAIEASWDERTSCLGAVREGNPAWGQCYPTARVVQVFFPEMEIARGVASTVSSEEAHFWNVIAIKGGLTHVDLTWCQFPPGTIRGDFDVLDRHDLGDSIETVTRCDLLLSRVTRRLAS